MIDIYQIVAQWINPPALVFCIIITEVIRRVLPTPPPDPPDDPVSKRDVGRIANRLLPLIPLAVGVLSVYAMEHDAGVLQFHNLIIKGVLTGGVAGFLYRTYKVSVLGV